jgi:hypothetical protein
LQRPFVAALRTGSNERANGFAKMAEEHEQIAEIIESGAGE